MTGSSSGGPEQKDDKRLNEDLVVFMRKRSDTDAPRYTARLKTYVDLQQKRRRATVARRHTEHAQHDKTAVKKKSENEQKEKGPSAEHPLSDEDQRVRRRVGGDKAALRSRSCSGEHLVDASGRCRRRRRPRRRRSGRRRSRRRRRRSCRRCYSRRRRSRRRRRSCRRRSRSRRRRRCSRRRRYRRRRRCR